jgi:quinone-modifying oxidoreductase subunit QmoC
MGFVEVANVSELDDGQMIGFEVAGRRILLAKVEGEFFAIGATCTHERSNLDQGALLGHVVYCPLHYSAFDVRSGAVLGPPAECPVPAHEVRVEDGKVLVSAEPLDSAAPAAATTTVSEAAPADVTQAAPADVTQAAPADVTQAAPADVSQAAPADVSQAAPADVTQAAPADVTQAAPADVTQATPADVSQAAPELVGATRDLAERVAGLEQTVQELRRELAERVAGLDQTVRELFKELAPPKPARATPLGGDPWLLQEPRFMGRITTSARHLPVAIAIPGALVALLVLTAAVLFEDGPAVPDGDILFEHFIGHGWLDVFALSLVGVVGLLAAMGLRRYYRALQATVPPGIARQPLAGAVRETAAEVVRHKDFDDWTSSDVRRGSHLAIFYGFLGLVAATTGAALYTEIFPILGIDWQGNELSLPIWDPVKIIGNVGGIALLVGLAQTLSIWRRRPAADRATYSDWFFPGLLALTAVTGFLTEMLRFAGVRMAYPAYAVHLVFVFALFVYFPFSKFAHVMYHPAARAFGRQIRRKPAPAVAPTASPLDPDAAAV